VGWVVEKGEDGVRVDYNRTPFHLPPWRSLGLCFEKNLAGEMN